MHLFVLFAAATLGLASLAALWSTQRSRHPFLRGRLGWWLTAALAGTAIFLLARPWGLAVAIAAAVLGLMAVIPAVATVLGWQQRKERELVR